ncbi:unnamed protein product [Allacma fusca]|uniref:BTB domain-containing protein n=1 Tax=Allacma fusca TaxID=39272 RepID=A0A8J2J6L8_9HEXA|nr:unnamed protein product [Allacma fusca]
MFLTHGGRPCKGNGRKRKGVDEYAAENRIDFTSRSIIRDGQLVRILVCRFCCQSIGARSDRIKEHLASKRHQKLKLEAFKEAAEAGRDLSQEYSDDNISGLLPEPPITMLKFPGKALAHLLEGEGRELTPEGEDRKHVIPTPPPLKEHVMNSPPPQPAHPVAMHSGVVAGAGGLGGRTSTGALATPPPPPPPQKEFSPQQLLCVRWGNYDSNIVSMFSKLRNQEQFVDLTLWCEGRTIKCHKMILSACSTYFEQLLTETQNLHPIIFLKDMRFWEIQALVEFMYKGEVSIHQDKLQSLLRAAESLQIKGLGSPSNDITGQGSNNSSVNEDDMSNSTVDMSTTATPNNRNSVNNSSYLSNSHNTSMTMNMGMDLSNHGTGVGQNSSTSGSAQSSGGGPAKRRKKETPRRIDIPRAMNHPLQASYNSPMRSDDLIDDDDPGSDDSMTAHERNNIDLDGMKQENQSDANYEDSIDGDGDNYGDNEQGSQSIGDDSNDQAVDVDDDIESGALSLRMNVSSSDRERSRKGNPIKKIHLGIGNNNNNNNDTGGGATLLHHTASSGN